jgi:hypothetical protein
VLDVDEALQDLQDLLSTLYLSLCRVIAADNPDGADDLASEAKFGGGSELGDATLGSRDGTIESVAPPGTFANSDGGTLRKLVVRLRW